MTRITAFLLSALSTAWPSTSCGAAARAGPEVLLHFRRERIGGKEGQRRTREDADWNRDGGVTAHGRGAGA